MTYLHLFEHPESKTRRLRAKLLRKARLLIAEGKVVADSLLGDTYRVYPIIYTVEKHNGVWKCDCERFKNYGICEDIMAARILAEGEASK